MSTQIDIAQIIALISASFPIFSPTKDTIRAYFECLHDLPAKELKEATLHCISENGRKFPPTIGELRAAVLELRKASVNLPSPYEAWQEVLRQMNINGGENGKPVWSHPLVERAVNILGWRNLRMSENQVADRAHFTETYEQLVARISMEEMLLPEVRAFIESKGGKLLLSPLTQIKQLTDKLSVK